MASNNTKQSLKKNDLIKKHPQLREFKRKAKILYNQLQQEAHNENINLSYCQDLVAKQHGYKHWHEFHTLIKKEFTPDSTINFIYDNTLFKNNNDCYLGYSSEMKKYIWLSIESKKNIVIGATPTLQKRLTFSLLQQQIKANNHVVYFHNMDDGETLKKIQHAVLEAGREDDLYYISLDKYHPNSIETNYFLLDHFNIESSGAITELISRLVKYNEYQTKERTIYLLSSILMLGTYLRNTQNIKLDINQIRKYLLLENLLKELSNTHLPDYIHNSIKSYVTTLPGFNQKTMLPSEHSLDVHGSLQMQIMKSLGMLEYEYSYLFKNEEELKELNIECKELIGLGNPKIFIIQHSLLNENTEDRIEEQQTMIQFWLYTIAGTYSKLMPYEFETVFDKELKLTREKILKEKKNSILFLDINNEIFLNNSYAILHGFTQMKSWKVKTIIYGTHIIEICKKHAPIEITETPSLNIAYRTYALKLECKTDYINIKHDE